MGEVIEFRKRAGSAVEYGDKILEKLSQYELLRRENADLIIRNLELTKKIKQLYRIKGSGVYGEDNIIA